MSSILFQPHHRLSRGTAACAVKKHGRYEFRFTLRGSSTHCPIKKLCLRGSRSSRTYRSFAVRVFIIIVVVFVIEILSSWLLSSPSCKCFVIIDLYFGRRNGRNWGRRMPLGSDGKTDVRKEVRPYWDWTDADARIGWEGGEGGERVLRRWKSGGCSTSGIFPPATYVFLCDRRDRRPWWLPRRR